jgi:DNA-binding NtrC family response regulator
MMNWQVVSIPMLPSFEGPKWIPGGQSHEFDGPDRVGASHKIKIIVIDDEALIAETVVEILRQEGFEAAAVSNGFSAIELARDWKPDVVLSDVIMPGINGIDAGIKIHEVAPKCKVILFSGQAATVDLLEEARLQGYEFQILAKPIKPEQFVSAIRGAARRSS